ncbi:MAG: histidine phosphatase family protein [Anaerolineales bacterium]|nr:histidine phosphatase family protein [Anaerolineales bacterium]
MHLYFIRHAQSTNNALYASGDPSQVRTHDPELTDLGRKQAEMLAGFLARGYLEAVARSANGARQPDPQNRQGFPITHLYSSLMVRAVATGATIAARLGLPLHAWIDWHEEGGLFLEPEPGQYVPQTGKNRAFFAEAYPVLVLPETLGAEGWHTGGFEPREARPERARRVLAELLQRHGEADDHVAVISHGGFYTHFLAALLDLKPPYALSFAMNNASISRIAFASQGRYALYQNRCEYLPREMITN